MTPCVSIIIPVYNVEQYIEECIKSVIKQSLQNIEIIIVNDGTRDNSINIIRKYIESDKRIKLIDKKNGGLSSARNVGLDVAKGEYILFLDSDDWIEHTMAEDMYNYAVENKVDIVTSGYNRIDNNICTKVKSPIESNRVYNKTEILNIISNESNNITWFVWRNLYSRELITKNKIRFNENVKIGEDTAFNLEAFLSSNYIMSIPKNLYNYRNNPNSLTQSSYKPNLEDSLINQYNEKLKIYKKHNLNKKAFIDLNLYFSTHSLNMIIANIYNTNNNDKIEDLKKIRELDAVKSAINNIGFIDIIKSNYSKGIKLRSILMKYKRFKLLNRLCEV